MSPNFTPNLEINNFTTSPRDPWDGTPHGEGIDENHITCLEYISMRWQWSHLVVLSLVTTSWWQFLGQLGGSSFRWMRFLPLQFHVGFFVLYKLGVWLLGELLWEMFMFRNGDNCKLLRVEKHVINIYFRNWWSDTVDGRTPAPVEVGSLSHYLQGFIHPRWLFGISEPSTLSHCTKVKWKKLRSSLSHFSYQPTIYQHHVCRGTAWRWCSCFPGFSTLETVWFKQAAWTTNTVDGRYPAAAGMCETYQLMG